MVLSRPRAVGTARHRSWCSSESSGGASVHTHGLRRGLVGLRNWLLRVGTIACRGLLRLKRGRNEWHWDDCHAGLPPLSSGGRVGCDVGIKELGTTELSTLRGGERRGESGERKRGARHLSLLGFGTAVADSVLPSRGRGRV